MSRSGSGALQDRELNGQVLLAELAVLRKALVPQKVLNALAQEVRVLPHLPLARAMEQLKALSERPFHGYPAVTKLLEAWLLEVKGARDVEALVGHLERLALVSALLTGLWQGARRLAADRGARG